MWSKRVRRTRVDFQRRCQRLLRVFFLKISKELFVNFSLKDFLFLSPLLAEIQDRISRLKREAKAPWHFSSFRAFKATTAKMSFSSLLPLGLFSKGHDVLERPGRGLFTKARKSKAAG